MNTQQQLDAPTNTIPWIDMHAFLHGTEKERIAIAMEFGKSLQQLGFVAVNNIGITPSLIDHAYAIAERYFRQPNEIKLKTHTRDGHCGFTPFGSEHAKYTDTVDLKEFFQARGPHHPAHLWPELHGFQQAIIALYNEMEECMRHLLQATAIYLGYTKPNEYNILANMISNSSCVMRVLHYPPVEPNICPAGGVRSAAHEDLSMITIIPRATSSGLQVKTLNNEWIDVVAPDNAAIINAGDALNIMTNGIIPSTTHRVVNAPGGDKVHRYSIHVYGNLTPDTPLSILDKCPQTPARFKHFNSMTFNEFREQRYSDIGLSKQA